MQKKNTSSVLALNWYIIRYSMYFDTELEVNIAQMRTELFHFIMLDDT